MPKKNRERGKKNKGKSKTILLTQKGQTMKNRGAVTGLRRSYEISDNAHSLIELYKAKFGDTWKQVFEATVRIDLRRAT